ncbi:hypothetical protein SAMN06272739_1290 [Blastococcus haudaquaticus]|uniref:Uncharacterized protein n=1 Tax=Blastococcus haudaquaticus TaxID=1938745 RepID=A0A286GKF9_9ACTN|nr:hypothetical protein SAMN06272739_1290 [Blastococcus haudaquaticus]
MHQPSWPSSEPGEVRLIAGAADPARSWTVA